MAYFGPPLCCTAPFICPELFKTPPCIHPRLISGRLPSPRASLRSVAINSKSEFIPFFPLPFLPGVGFGWAVISLSFSLLQVLKYLDSFSTFFGHFQGRRSRGGLHPTSLELLNDPNTLSDTLVEGLGPSLILIETFLRKDDPKT